MRKSWKVTNYVVILQVNVAQADINIFLRTAEELQIKGLTQKEKNQTP